MSTPLRLPYFDALLQLLQEDHLAVWHAFGRHVHWGYWPDPRAATGAPEDFAVAAESLSRLVYHSAKVHHDSRILDVGCGFGGTLESINNAFLGVEALGLNLDRRQLQRARHRFRPRSGNHVGWLQADADRLPFAEGVFDSVLAVECIFHFPSRQQFFQEAYRVLKPGGRLALSDFVPITSWAPLMTLASVWPASRGFYGRCHLDCTVAHYERLAATTGFTLALRQDITRETLPTYAFLRALARQVKIPQRSAILETVFAELASRLGGLRYMVMSFEKPGVHTRPEKPWSLPLP